MAQSFIKDPDATLDYTVDWSSWLGADTIASATVTADTGITVSSSTASTTAVTAWLTGGTANTNYNVIVRITTVAGRIDDRTILIQVRNQ